MCRFPCPCSILPSSHIHPNARSVTTHRLSSMCYRVPLHTYTYAELCTHITSSFSHSTPTHPLLPSLMYQCVYKAVFLSASSSVCSALSVSISIHLSLSFFFLFEALWFEQRQSSERQVSSLFTAESSSILRALLIFGSL